MTLVKFVTQMENYYQQIVTIIYAIHVRIIILEFLASTVKELEWDEDTLKKYKNSGIRGYVEVVLLYNNKTHYSIF